MIKYTLSITKQTEGSAPDELFKLTCRVVGADDEESEAYFEAKALQLLFEQYKALKEVAERMTREG